jgi:hypothetical protein
MDNTHPFTYSSVAMLALLAIAITMSPTSVGKMEPSYAQSTFDAPSSPDSTPDASSPTETGNADDEDNFQQFMQCLFEGEASEEDISNALDGNTDSSPTEQEIRDCFAPLYNTGGTTGTTATAGSGSADETDDSSPSENEEDSSTDSETSDNEEQPN